MLDFLKGWTFFSWGESQATFTYSMISGADPGEGYRGQMTPPSEIWEAKNHVAIDMNIH